MFSLNFVNNHSESITHGEKKMSRKCSTSPIAILCQNPLDEAQKSPPLGRKSSRPFVIPYRRRSNSPDSYLNLLSPTHTFTFLRRDHSQPQPGIQLLSSLDSIPRFSKQQHQFVSNSHIQIASVRASNVIPTHHRAQTELVLKYFSIFND